MLAQCLDYRRRNHSEACINKSPGAPRSSGPSSGLILRNFFLSSHGLHASLFGNELLSPEDFLGLLCFHLPVCSSAAGRCMELLQPQPQRHPLCGCLLVGSSFIHHHSFSKHLLRTFSRPALGWNRRKTWPLEMTQPTEAQGHTRAEWCNVASTV